MTPKQQLTRIVQLNKSAITSWAEMQQLRTDLLRMILDPAEDTSEIKGMVSVSNKRTKLAVPEIIELRQQIDTQQQELFSTRQEQIYAAQLAVQAAEEALADVLTTPEIKAMQNRLALLENEHADAQPELTKVLIVRKAASALLDP